MSNEQDLYPKKRVSIRKYTASYLNKIIDQVTYADVELFCEYIHTELHINNLSPRQVAEKLHLDYHGDFGGFIKTSLKIKLKDLSSAVKTFINNRAQILLTPRLHTIPFVSSNYLKKR